MMAPAKKTQKAGNATTTPAEASPPAGATQTFKEPDMSVRGHFGFDRACANLDTERGRVTMLLMGGRPSKSGKSHMMNLDIRDFAEYCERGLQLVKDRIPPASIGG